jgi:hypothetical protein
MNGRKKKSKKPSGGNPEHSQPEPLVLFLDESLHNCKPIHLALDNAGIKYIRHGSIFAPGVEDTEWLPRAGQERWPILTADKRIRFNVLEREQVMAYRIRQFVFTSGNLSGTMMGEILKLAVPRMRAVLVAHKAPFIACITKSGQVEVRYDEHGPVQRRK